MVKNLPSWLFLAIALVLIGAALLPVLRAMIGVDAKIGLPFTTVVMLMIGGLMSGLSAMILLVRSAPKLAVASEPEESIQTRALVLHASGILIFTAIPLLNFLVAYWLWGKYRHQHPHLNWVGQEVLNYQIAIYLYLLLSLFLVFAGLGVITTPLLLLLHLVCTIYALATTARGKAFSYPANIPIIQGRRAGY